MLELNRIYLGDCLELMNDLPDKSIDMICCDLPYGVLKPTNPNAIWDKPLPLDLLWKQYKRIIKDNGAIVLFGQGMFTSDLMQSNKSMWRYNLIWNKCLVTGFLNANRMPLRQHEDILIFYKTLPKYNPQMVKAPWHKRNHRRSGVAKNNCYGNYGETVSNIVSDEKFPTSIIEIPKRDNNKVYHPTEKSIELLRWLIRTYTDKGDIVLDNCCGSGTTCIAAIRDQRRFIGMELSEKFYNIACERIESEPKQIELF